VLHLGDFLFDLAQLGLVFAARLIIRAQFFGDVPVED
jgi:hypothetical protein